MTEIEKILRLKTCEMFTDKWYEQTADAIYGVEKNNKGYVYFVKNGCNNFVKIGKSINLQSRLQSFSTSFSDGVFLVGYIYSENYSELEKIIHQDFKDKRKTGEWFDILDSEITYNDFYLKNAFFNKGSSVIDGECFNLQNTNITFGVKDYYDEFYKYCNNEIKKGIKYDKAIFYKKIISLNKNYNVLSKKRVNLVLKQWAKTMGYNYEATNTNGYQYFFIN